MTALGSKVVVLLLLIHCILFCEGVMCLFLVLLTVLCVTSRLVIILMGKGELVASLCFCLPCVM